jgi:hypothetical protein
MAVIGPRLTGSPAVRETVDFNPAPGFCLAAGDGGARREDRRELGDSGPGHQRGQRGL